MEKILTGPHIRFPKTTKVIMRDVCIALLPALAASIYFFGWVSLYLTLVSVITCVLSEWLWQKLCRQPVTVGDYSAVVTGILLAFNMTALTPVWVVVIAAMFSIIVAKQCFGGIGSNFANPALVGRLFVMLVYPSKIMNYTAPFPDETSSATVLSALKTGTEVVYSGWDLFVGKTPGALGETSSLCLLLGFAYLVWRKEVNGGIAAAYLLTVIAITTLSGGNPVYHLFGGGLMLGALFMLTDYSFSTKRGRILLGVTAGIVTGAIRVFGAWPEGVCFGILTANCLAGWIEKVNRPHVYGVEKA